MDPVTGAVVIGLNLLGGFGAYRNAKHQHRYRLQVAKARAKYQRNVAYNHAVLAEQEASDVLRSGSKARDLLGKKAARTISGIRAGMASSGFKVDGGDAYKLTEDVHTAVKADRDEIRRQAARRADLARYRAAMLRHGADYNLAMASHDPGGPQFGQYFMRALIQSGRDAASMGAFDGIKLPWSTA